MNAETLMRLLMEESAACLKSSGNGPAPRDEIFYISSIVLASLASRIRMNECGVTSNAKPSTEKRATGSEKSLIAPAGQPVVEPKAFDQAHGLSEYPDTSDIEHCRENG